jgi:hypothetical protein
MNKFWRKQEAEPAPPPADAQLRTEIRDLLRGQPLTSSAPVEPQPAG